MTREKKLSEQADSLRKRAEEIARSNAAGLPENLEALPAEQTRQLLHDLRVHQVELEMQNEELRRTQVELEDSRARYFDLYELAPVGYVTIGENDLILGNNLTAANLLGVARSAMLKKPLTRFIVREDQDIFYSHRKQLFESGNPQVCELRMLRKDGSRFWARMEAIIVKNDDGTPVCRAVLSDISASQKVEEALQDAKEKLELALGREQKLARTDSLTGLYNRRYFFELAAREFNATRRYRRPLAIIMFDTDSLKTTNDTFGHAAGDRLLELVAHTAARHMRAVDVLARYGGDEFIIMLPETSVRNALPIAERIRASVAAIQVETGKGPAGITISIGIAALENEPADHSIEAVIQRADNAMYVAKAEGRNRTAVFPRIP